MNTCRVAWTETCPFVLSAPGLAREAPGSALSTTSSLQGHPRTTSPGEGTPTAAPPVEIREWDVPGERTRPRDPSVGPDGRVRVVETDLSPNRFAGFLP